MNLNRVIGLLVLIGLFSLAAGFVNWLASMPTMENLQNGYSSCLWSSTYHAPIVADIFRGDQYHIPCRTMAPLLNGIGLVTLLFGGAVAFVKSEPDKLLSEPSSFDLQKWNALVEYDADIKRIVDALAPFGQKYVDEFAQAFMALNDKKYLPQIIEKILATAKADAARVVLEKEM